MTTPLSDRDLLAKLIAFDSTSCESNLPISGFISDYLEGFGAHIQHVASADGRKTNLVATFGPAAADRSGLILSGHMDTVPADEPEWTSNPFEMAELDDRYAGRGTADMKGFLAVAMNAAITLNTRTLRSPLVLLFTYDEEVGTLGAKRFVDEWLSPETLPVKTIIGEPTSLRVVRMHKGHLKLRLLIRGRGAHSGYPHLGINAIERAAPVIERIAELRRTLERERPAHSAHFGDVPFVPLNIATIRGGAAVNIVPDRCEIEIGARLLPGMLSESLVETIRDAAGDLLDSLEIVSDSPPMILENDNSFYRSIESILGQKETVGVNFATDAGWFQKLGMQCVLFGPGSIEVAHRPNEFMPRDEFFASADLLRSIISENTSS